MESSAQRIVGEPTAAAAERAQAIHCNGLAVAVPYRQARSVIEDDTIAPVPNAPPWLLGAANIDGHIVPVVDLHAWIEPARPRPAGRSRLLLCGDAEDRLALCFEGLPQMVQVQAPAQPAAPALKPLPLALQPYQRGWATTPQAAAAMPATTAARDALAAGSVPTTWWPVLDLEALMRTWSGEMAAGTVG